MVVIVRADLLHEAIIRTCKGDVYADDFERWCTQPRNAALSLLLVADLRRVVTAQRGLLRSIHLLVLDVAVERPRLAELPRSIPKTRVEFDCRSGRNQNNRHVALPGAVLPEKNAERPIPVVNNFTRDEHGHFDGLDVRVEISPAKLLLHLASFHRRTSLAARSRLAHRWDSHTFRLPR